jgi:hypothetical protein
MKDNEIYKKISTIADFSVISGIFRLNGPGRDLGNAYFWGRRRANETNPTASAGGHPDGGHYSLAGPGPGFAAARGSPGRHPPLDSGAGEPGRLNTIFPTLIFVQYTRYK